MAAICCFLSAKSKMHRAFVDTALKGFDACADITHATYDMRLVARASSARPSRDTAAPCRRLRNVDVECHRDAVGGAGRSGFADRCACICQRFGASGVGLKRPDAGFE